MFRRETIIALRARHEAYRIATEILYPHVASPQPPPQPAMPVDPPDFSPFRRPLDVMGLTAVAIIYVMVGLVWLLHWLYSGT